MIPDEVDDLERVLQDVLPVARAEPQPSEHLDELLAELAAVRLEDRLRAGLVDLLLQLGLRLVVHLLDPGRVDPPVLDQLLERHLRDLATDPVERREHDRVRRVVHDHVDARQVLERPDVAALAADDPPLHVVARELDDRDGGLGRVAGGDPLERIGHERPRTSPRLRAGLLLHLPHRPRELVPDEVLRPLEHRGLGLAERHPRDPLELLQRLARATP